MNVANSDKAGSLFQNRGALIPKPSATSSSRRSAPPQITGAILNAARPDAQIPDTRAATGPGIRTDGTSLANTEQNPQENPQAEKMCA